MHSIKKIVGVLLVISILCLTSCGRQAVEFDPQFYVGDYLGVQVMNRNGEVISCQEEKFNQIACMTKDKIKELRKILKHATVPKENAALLKKVIKELKAVSKK